MTSLDEVLVRRWFERARDTGEPVAPQWGIVPTPQERRVLAAGGAAVAAAVCGKSADDDEIAVEEQELTELPALMLRR